jgi:TDG/mug DNA glycosylase family protein
MYVVARSKAELESFRNETVPDLLTPGLRLLFVGINPGLRSAAAQSHFANRGNRFYPALHRAGVVDRAIDASEGMTQEDLAYLRARGVGITNLVARATARADELSTGELVVGVDILEHKVRQFGPNVVAVLGISAYRIAFRAPGATVGRQTATLGGAQLWVAPNPSGRNAHASLTQLAIAYKDLAMAAGVEVFEN